MFVYLRQLRHDEGAMAEHTSTYMFLVETNYFCRFPPHFIVSALKENPHLLHHTLLFKGVVSILVAVSLQHVQMFVLIFLTPLKLRILW